jgi:hypothetical protein
VVGIISLLSIVNLRQDLTGAAGGEPATLVVIGKLRYLMYRSSPVVRAMTVLG